MTTNHFQFPNYLGYAKAIPESYRIDQKTGKESLNYEYKGQTTLEVELTSKNATIYESFNDKFLGISSDVNLTQAFFNHYRDVDPLIFPIQVDWINSVIDFHNVYADIITKSSRKQLFFPALFLIDIRVPFNDDHLLAADEFVCKEENKKFQPWIQCAEFSINYPDRVDLIDKQLLSIICPIAYSLDILQEIEDSGLINQEKVFRPLVSLAQPVKGNNTRLFVGNTKDEWGWYTISYQHQKVEL